MDLGNFGSWSISTEGATCIPKAAITLDIDPHSSLVLDFRKKNLTALVFDCLCLITICYLWPPYGIGQAVIFCPVVSFFFLVLTFFPCLISAVADWMALVRTQNAGLKCAARDLLEMHDTKNCHLITNRTTLLGHIFATEARIDNRKKLVKQQYLITSPICPYNMVNFGSLTAEICWRVWGTPANFNGFRILAALLHGTLVVGVSQTLRR